MTADVFKNGLVPLSFICCIFCVPELTCAVKQINLLAVSSKRWDILLVFDVFSPPPLPPLSLSLSLSLSTFTFQFSHRFSYCLSSSVGMVSCLKLLSYFLSLHVDPSLSPRKKNWSGILFSLLTYSLSRDVHMHRKNDQRHIYSSNLKFFFMRFSQPGHLRGCCHISPNVSLPLPPGIS